MAVAPKLITNREEEDYASLYQDNFVKRNDPAMLGTKAMNRQLSQGVQNTMSGNDVILGDTRNDPQAPTTPTTDCQPGYKRNAQGICVVDSPTAYSTAEQTAASTPVFGSTVDLYDNGSSYEGPSLPEEDDDDKKQVGGQVGGQGNTMRQTIDEEQQRLNQLFTDEERYLNEEFNRYYDDLVRQAEQRDARSGTSPFTGGIARGLEDYMSAAEIEALGNLQMERDRRLTDLRQRKDNIRTQSIKNVLEQKTAEMQTIDQQIQYSQQLAQYVISGSLTLEDANQLADELGLSNTQELIADAVQKQVTAGAFTEEEAKAELENLGIDPNILTGKTGGGQDIVTSTEAASEFSQELDSILGDFDFDLGEALAVGIAGAGTGAAVGAGIGLAGGVFAPVSVPLGTVVGTVVGFVGGFISGGWGTTSINERDLPLLFNPILESGIVTDSFYNGESKKIEVLKTPSANNSKHYLDDAYAITVDGTNYSFEGADLLILASVLKRQGKNNAEKYPQYQAIFTEANKIYSRGYGPVEGSVDNFFGLKRSNSFEIYKKIFNK
jgi:hypothetical protein